MEKYGLIKYGEIIETFEDKEVGMKTFMKRDDKSSLGFRKLFFSELTEAEKLLSMENRLQDLQVFLTEIKGSGRTYSSSTHIDAYELGWLIKQVKKAERYESSLREVDTHIRSASEPIDSIVSTLKNTLPEYQE